MRLDPESLLAAQRAARSAADPAAAWWHRLEAAAGAAVTEHALDDLLEESLEAMRQVIGADEVSLLLADASGSQLIARASTGLGAPRTSLSIPSGAGMAGRVLQSGQSLVIADLTTTELVSPTLREQGICSVVAVPVGAEPPLGVLHAGSKQPARFDDSDCALVSVMADRIAVALVRVRQFETERALRHEAEQLAIRLAWVQHVTAQLAATSTLDEVATVVATILEAGRSENGAGPGGDPSAGPRAADAATGGSAPGFSAPASLPSATASLWLSDGAGPDQLEAAGPAGARRRSPLAGEVTRAAWDAARPIEAVRDGHAVRAHPVLRGGEVVAVVCAEACLVDLAALRPLLGVVADQLVQALERVRLFAEQAELSAVSSFFARAARVTAEASGLQETLERLASVALPVLGDVCLIDLVTDGGLLTRMVAQHRDPSLQPLVDRLRVNSPDPEGQHPAVEVIRSGVTRWSATMPEPFLAATSRGQEHLSVMNRLGFRSYLSVPLVAGGEVLGAVTMVSTSRPFRPGNVAFAERLAQQVAAVVANARRYDATFRTSHLLQQSLLPRRLPDVAGLEVATRYLAATRGLEVGGDFYDVIVLPSGRTGFMIGDVAGHDGDAAAMMGHLRSAARALAGQVAGPSELVGALQWSWPLLGFERIATAAFGQLDQASGELALASAGHYPPLLLASGSARYLDLRPAPPLGAAHGATSEQLAAPGWLGRLERDELLVCYTDGAIDERKAGVDASMDLLAEAALAGPADAESVCDRLLATLSADRADDVALLALRRLAVAGEGTG